MNASSMWLVVYRVCVCCLDECLRPFFETVVAVSALVCISSTCLFQPILKHFFILLEYQELSKHHKCLKDKIVQCKNARSATLTKRPTSATGWQSVLLISAQRTEGQRNDISSTNTNLPHMMYFCIFFFALLMCFKRYFMSWFFIVITKKMCWRNSGRVGKIIQIANFIGYPCCTQTFNRLNPTSGFGRFYIILSGLPTSFCGV